MSVLACNNKSFDQMQADYKKMKDLLNKYQAASGIIPAPVSKTIEVLDQAFISGENIKAAFESVCMEMGNFLSSNEEYCARFAGFANKADFLKQTADGTKWQEADQYDICLLQNYYRVEQSEAVKRTLNIGNPKSFVSVFIEKTRNQLWEILSSYLKDKAKDKAKDVLQ